VGGRMRVNGPHIQAGRRGFGGRGAAAKASPLRAPRAPCPPPLGPALRPPMGRAPRATPARGPRVQCCGWRGAGAGAGAGAGVRGRGGGGARGWGWGRRRVGPASPARTQTVRAPPGVRPAPARVNRTRLALRLVSNLNPATGRRPSAQGLRDRGPPPRGGAMTKHAVRSSLPALVSLLLARACAGAADPVAAALPAPALRPAAPGAALRARCAVAAGAWCGPYYSQTPVDRAPSPVFERACPRGCSGVGVCHRDTGACHCPAGRWGRGRMQGGGTHTGRRRW
jgi:hypothetical protein